LFDESQGDTSPYQKLYQQFGAVCGNDIVPSKKKSVMVNTRRTNLGQNNTQEEAESIGSNSQSESTVSSSAEERRGSIGSKCGVASYQNARTIVTPRRGRE
jgi:hypothetical protein